MILQGQACGWINPHTAKLLSQEEESNNGVGERVKKWEVRGYFC